MLFTLDTTIRELNLNVSPEETLNLDFGGTNSITLRMRKPTAEEQKSGHLSYNAFCTAGGAWEPSTEVITALDLLFEKELPPGSNTEDLFPGDVTAEGRIRDRLIVPLSCLPEYYQGFTRVVYRELARATRLAVSLLRWRYALTGPHSPLGIRSMKCLLDGENWMVLPTPMSAHVGVLSALDVKKVSSREIEAFSRNGIVEPLGRELFLEAWNQRVQNPRSALAIGIAAAEVGFKHYVAQRVPDARWLVENVPSPPLFKMLRDYFPTLKPNFESYSGNPFIPKAILTDINQGAELRNKVVHGNPADCNVEKVEEILWAVHDLLYLLDYFNGFLWAVCHTRVETQSALKAGQIG